MDIRTNLGDSRTLQIPLTWQGSPFVPDVADSLIFTVKTLLTDPDSEALIQKTNSGGGISVTGSIASISLLHEDSKDLDAVTTYYDVQWQSATTGAVRTVAGGRIVFGGDVTKETNTSIPVRTIDAGTPGNPAPAIHAATSKTTPVDADEFGIADSAASFGLKKLTWSNLKAAAKAYFDTIYQAALGYTPADADDLAAKQDALVSGTNIKTVNGQSILGSGNLEAGGDVDNAAVVAAIATNRGATRGSLYLEQEPAINSLLAPRIVTELIGMTRLQNDQKQVVVFGLGDSLSQRTPQAMDEILRNNVHISGYAFPEPTVVSGSVSAPGTAMNGNFDPTVIDHGRVWTMEDGAVMNVGYSPLGTALKFPSNAIVVWCSKRSGGGSLAVSYSEDNGTTWTSPAGWTIATNGTAKTMAKQEFRIGTWAIFEGTGEVYTTYNPAADTVAITGATGAYSGYNVTATRDGEVNGRAAYTVTGAVKVHWSTDLQRWQIGNPAATNPDYYINSVSEYPPTCVTERDTTGVRSRLWRVTASGGQVDYIGAKVWDHLGSGVIMAHAGNGGLALSHANQGAAAIRNGIGRDLGPTLLMPTIVTNQADNPAVVNATTIATFIDNWLAAIPVCDMVFFGNFAWPEGRDALNDTIKTVASTRPAVAFYDPISVARGYGYADAQGWRSPDPVHYDNEFWRVLAVDFYRRVFIAASRALTFSGISLTPNIFRLGSIPTKTASARNFEIPFGEDNRGTFGLVSMGQSTSNGRANFFRMFWNPHPADANTNFCGIEHLTNGFDARNFQFDRNGAIALGPTGTVSASSKSATVWVKSRSTTFTALTVETSSTGSTEKSQSWRDSSAERAYMTSQGNLHATTVMLPGPYTDDAAAAAASPTVPVGGLYRQPSGVVAWRQA